MSLNVANCPRCGRVFAKGINEVCRSCMKVIEKEYERCAQYLRENKGCNIHELSEETEVSIRQITKFIREGRISLMDFPNMGFPCESCGVMIREGNLCGSCRSKLSKEINQLREYEHERDRKQRESHTVFEIKKDY